MPRNMATRVLAYSALSFAVRISCSSRLKVFSLLCAPWLFETGPPILRHIVWICLECSLRPEIRLAPWLRLLHIEEPFVTQAFDFLLDTARWEDLDGLTAISLQVSSVSVSIVSR